MIAIFFSVPLALSLSVGSVARVFVAEGDAFCALQAAPCRRTGLNVTTQSRVGFTPLATGFSQGVKVESPFKREHYQY